MNTTGTKLYIVDVAAFNIYEYSLSTAWDITTATQSYKWEKPCMPSGTNYQPESIFIKDDGLKVFIGGTAGSPKGILQFSLSVAWDLSTASYDSVIIDPVLHPRSMWFMPDGMSFYLANVSSDNIYQFTMSSAWDITTAILCGTYDHDFTPCGICIRGNKIYHGTYSNDTISQLRLRGV